MAYFCNDCSYRSPRSGQAGKCQACGSYNLTSGAGGGTQEKKPPGKARLVILAVLWAYLLGTIIWKLST